MQLNVRITILLQIIMQFFFAIVCGICYASDNHFELKINDDIVNINDLIYLKQNDYEYIHCSKINAKKNYSNHYDHQKYLEHLNNINNNIYTKYQDNQKSSLFLYHKKNIYNNFRIRFQNDTINLLHTFYNKYPRNFTYDQILYFSQFSIQRFLSNNTVTLGLGTRYLCNNQRIVGYNAMFHIPISSHIQQPYSINIGGEYWYKNCIFSLNGYYNLDKIINFYKLLHDTRVLYPQMGYQMKFQLKLPYISECQSQVKWEQFYHNKQDENLLHNSNKAQCALSMGMQYQPIPILELNIDNIFIHKKYVNTVFKIALNYQFNIPISQQLHHKKYNNTQLSASKNLNIVMESFSPKFYNIITNHLIMNYKLIGFPGEIKFVTINDNEELLQYNMKLSDNYKAKIVNTKNNTYAVYFPKLLNYQNAQISSRNDTKENMNELLKKDTPILTKKFVIKDNNVNKQIYNSSVFTDNSGEPCIIELNAELAYQNQDDQNINNELNSLNSPDNASSSLNNTFCNNDNTIIVNDNNSNDQDSFLNFPPPPPEMPTCVYNQASFAHENQPSCSKSNYSSNLNVASNSLVCDSPKNNITETKSNTNIIYNKNNDLHHQLSIQKHAKFSSIGTEEYIERLERAILERKKNNQMTDMEKMFNKLHLTLSQSSIAESLETNDSIDSFSETSNS